MPLPNDISAERAFLWQLIDDRYLVFDLAERVKPEMMHNALHRRVYQSIIDVANTDGDFDFISITNHMDDFGVVNQTELMQIFNPDLMYYNIESLINSIRSHYEQREVIKASLLMQQSLTANGSADEAISGAQAILDTAKKVLGGGIAGIAQQIAEYEAKLSRAMAGEAANDCVQTGLVALDSIIDGLFYGQNHVLCGATGMGKSSAMLSMVDVMIQAGKGVYVLSSEMGASQLINRIIARRLGADSRSIRKGTAGLAIMENALAQANIIRGQRLHIDDRSGVTPSVLAASVNALINRGVRIDLVVVDHLGLMKPGEKVNGAYERTTSVMRDLTIMAKNSTRDGRGFAMLTLSQLSRGVERRNDKRPQLSDLRDSGNVEQDSYMVIGVYRDAYYNPETSDQPNQVELVVMKNREGLTGTGRFKWIAKSASVHNATFKEVRL
jgi:replicative DNA helicase